jgi:mannose-6-phosphate isomerase-like protein (cupin superfamily)
MTINCLLLKARRTDAAVCPRLPLFLPGIMMRLGAVKIQPPANPGLPLNENPEGAPASSRAVFAGCLPARMRAHLFQWRCMEYVAINFREKLSKFSDHWAPKVIAQMNDYQFKLVKIQGEFVWHSHAETDEVFIVLDGEMSIELPHGRVDLKAGDMFVVPKGVEHKPVAENECKMLLVEPAGTINTGDAGGEMTAEDNVWI